MRILKFTIKRFLIMLLTVLVVSFFVFILLRVGGQDPLNVIIGSKQDISEEARQALREQFNLDKPITQQYLIWLKGAIQGDFGIDYIQETDVTRLIGGRIQVTIGLVVLAMLFSIIISIPLGIISALKKNTSVDSAISLIMLVLTSMPGFLVAMIALVLLSIFMPGYRTVGTYTTFSEYLSRITVPALCLSFGNIALIGRVTRNGMVEQLNSDYVMTCKAKGISKSRMIRKHALKNSLVPVFTITGMAAGTLVGGSVLVEQVFSLAGIGSLLSDAVLKSNYPLVQALTLIMLVLFQVIDLVCDIAYTIIDPRIKI